MAAAPPYVKPDDTVSLPASKGPRPQAHKKVVPWTVVTATEGIAIMEACPTYASFCKHKDYEKVDRVFRRDCPEQVYAFIRRVAIDRAAFKVTCDDLGNMTQMEARFAFMLCGRKDPLKDTRDYVTSGPRGVSNTVSNTTFSDSNLKADLVTASLLSPLLADDGLPMHIQRAVSATSVTSSTSSPSEDEDHQRSRSVSSMSSSSPSSSSSSPGGGSALTRSPSVAGTTATSSGPAVPTAMAASSPRVQPPSRSVSTGTKAPVPDPSTVLTPLPALVAPIAAASSSQELFEDLFADEVEGAHPADVHVGPGVEVVPPVLAGVGPVNPFAPVGTPTVVGRGLGSRSYSLGGGAAPSASAGRRIPWSPPRAPSVHRAPSGGLLSPPSPRRSERYDGHPSSRSADASAAHGSPDPRRSVLNVLTSAMSERELTELLINALRTQQAAALDLYAAPPSSSSSRPMAPHPVGTPLGVGRSGLKRTSSISVAASSRSPAAASSSSSSSPSSPPFEVKSTGDASSSSRGAMVVDLGDSEDDDVKATVVKSEKQQPPKKKAKKNTENKSVEPDSVHALRSARSKLFELHKSKVDWKVPLKQNTVIDECFIQPLLAEKKWSDKMVNHEVQRWFYAQKHKHGLSDDQVNKRQRRARRRKRRVDKAEARARRFHALQSYTDADGSTLNLTNRESDTYLRFAAACEKDFQSSDYTDEDEPAKKDGEASPGKKYLVRATLPWRSALATHFFQALDSAPPSRGVSPFAVPRRTTQRRVVSSRPPPTDLNDRSKWIVQASSTSSTAAPAASSPSSSSSVGDSTAARPADRDDHEDE